MKRLISLVMLLAVAGCDAPVPAVPDPPAAEKQPTPHRFVNIGGMGQTGVALDTTTGQWCKTWVWAYTVPSQQGGLDTLPLCVSLLQENTHQ
jgi:hypothetical protein